MRLISKKEAIEKGIEHLVITEEEVREVFKLMAKDIPLLGELPEEEI